MGLLDQLNVLERQRFFHGQRLLASDLDELEAFHRELRELHNKSLHQPGIGNGFAVTGERGDREVNVGPGYGIDAEGREIVLTSDHLEPVPPVASEDDGGPVTYDLTIFQESDEHLEEAEIRAGICTQGGAVRLIEAPAFCWVRLELDLNGKLVPRSDALEADIRAGRKLRVARIEVQDCALKSLSIAHRLSARPPTQPRIACGRARAQWQVLPLQTEGSSLSPFLLMAVVDTSEASFLTTPCYSAGLRGSRKLQLQGQEGGPSAFYADGLLGIDEASTTSFRVQVSVILSQPQLLAADDPRIPELFRAWEVEWMGVE